MTDNTVRKSNAKGRLESAISRLICFQPLYGEVFLHLNKKPSTKVSTMGVGVVRRVDLALFYNQEFVDSLTDVELRAVLKHEALHVLLHHLSRSKHFAFNMRGYNIAADIVINQNVEGLPDGALYPKTFDLPTDQSSEWYYGALKKEADKQGKDFDEFMEGRGGLVDDHSEWGEFDDDIVSEKVRNIAEKAIKAQEQKGWGNINGNIVSQIMAANRPVVNWKKEVRYFINKLVLMGRKRTRMRPNRRYGNASPGTKRDYTSRLLVGFDTSGSVSDEQLKYFATELNGMIDHVIVDFIQFDTILHDEPKPFSKKKLNIDIVGRGGTCFHPIIELADEKKYDGLIVFTDGYAPFPDKPRARMLWAVTDRDKDVSFPYGKKVVIEEKKR
jgi:predicted metal-dependent peptidase